MRACPACLIISSALRALALTRYPRRAPQSRWQALGAFKGKQRTCMAQLAAARARHARRVAAAAAPPPAAVHVAECDLLDFLGDLEALPAGAGAGAEAPPDHAAWCLSPGDVAALLGDALQPSPPAAAVASRELQRPPSFAALTLSLKMPRATPDALPPALAATLHGWAGSALALEGAVQPGCTLLTVDVLLSSDAAAHLPAGGAAALEATLRDADGCEALAAPGAFRLAIGGDCAPKVAAQDLPTRAPPLRPRIALAAPRIELRLAAEARAPLRCRMHGALLAADAAGPAAVSLQLPRGFKHGVALFDYAPQAGDAAAPATAKPRPVLLTHSAAVAAELSAAFAADADDEESDALLQLLGTALHDVAAASPALLRAAMTLAAQRGWLSTLAALLSDASPLDEPQLAEALGHALAAAVVCAQHGAVAALLAAGAPPGAALHAAALMAASKDAARAAHGAEAAAALTVSADAAMAWFTAPAALPGDPRKAPLTPAAIAARGAAPACVALCAALAARLHAAGAMLQALPAGTRERSPAALLAAATQLPGGDVADLARALLRRAAEIDAKAVVGIAAPRRALLKATLIDASPAVVLVAAQLYHFAGHEAPRLTHASLHAAAAAQPLRLRMLRHYYVLEFAYAPWAILVVIPCAFAAFAPLHRVQNALTRGQELPALLVAGLQAVSAALYAARWALDAAGWVPAAFVPATPLLWGPDVAGLQLVNTITVGWRAMACRRDCAVTMPALLLRAAVLAYSLLVPTTQLIPRTQWAAWLLPPQIAFMLVVAAWHAGLVRLPRRRAAGVKEA